MYGDVHEILPDDMPEPLGESVTSTTTMDANLNHCLATGNSLAGCLHFVNKTPVDWYSKKQATVETATYGSEFVAAKTATEQIMDIRQTMRYLDAPVTTKSFLFGDNRSVVTSATLPHSTLTKRHNILAFHRVREAIAAKLMAFYWIQSAYNLSDMLSKHWDHPVENSSCRLFLISFSRGILNSSRLSCYLLLRLLVYMYLSQLMKTFTNYLKCIVISY